MQRVVFVAVFAAGAYSQISAFPSCALPPAISAVGTSGCSTTDYACICSNQAFASSLYSQIEAACSASDVQKAVSAAETLCSQAGVSITLAPGTSTAASAVTAAATAARVAAAPAGVVTQISDGQIQSPTNVTNDVTAPAATNNSTAPVAPSNATVPGAAPKNATSTTAVSPAYTAGAASLLGSLSSLVVVGVPILLFF
ncbi:GPI anchored CFEM domain protein [Teratosphaeria destructans]|uniref:GPI anchored CFEM domain protein n=1 Tax=Teratosphaeria destructans TaxID=418781 RepID=A0A9W7W075_9PEZI|nr:GPI anchored CFEM domain protein [Teratosphaeria destructans]